MEDLVAKQQKFTRFIAKLIIHAAELGYGLAFGEAWRTPEQAALNAKKGIGIKNSLHCDRLAVDFVLRIKGVYQDKSEAFKPLGEYWESLDPECAWGGRFHDGCHFSIAWQGRK